MCQYLPVCWLREQLDLGILPRYYRFVFDVAAFVRVYKQSLTATTINFASRAPIIRCVLGVCV